MPKYYCDYCKTCLTHDSPSVRKTHCTGKKHKDNVKLFYQNWMEEQTQHLIDATTVAFKARKIANSPLDATGKGVAIPLPQQLMVQNTGGFNMMPPGAMCPGGSMPPMIMRPHGPMPPMIMRPHGPMPPMMMGPHGPMPPIMMGPHGPMPPIMMGPHGPVPPIIRMRPELNNDERYAHGSCETNRSYMSSIADEMIAT